MTRYCSLIEKIISIALIFCGGLLFYYTSDYFFELLHIITWQKLSLLKFFRNFHIDLFLSLAMITGGVLLLFSKKVGWIMALIITFATPLVFLIPTDKYILNFISYDKKTLLFLLCIFVVCWLTFTALLFKAFQTKYSSTKRTWLTITLFVFLIILDKALIFLLS
jgi:hypothetical protein